MALSAVAVETEHHQGEVVEMHLGGFTIAGLGGNGPEMTIPQGTTIHVPVESYHPIGHGDGRIDNATLAGVLSGADAVVLPAKTELKVGHGRNETLVFVGSPALTWVLNSYADQHNHALAFIPETAGDGGMIIVEDEMNTENRVVVSDVRFLVTQPQAQ